jgi:MFS family permease
MHLGTGELSVALAGVSTGAVASMAIASALIARLTSARTVRIALCAAGAALWLPALARDTAQLTIGLFGFGVSMGTLDIAMNTQAVAVEREYGRALVSGIHGVYSIGFLLGAAVGALAAHEGLRPIHHFAAASLVVLAVGWWSSRRLLGAEADAPAPAEQGEGPSDGSATAADRRLVVILGLGAIAFCALFAEGAVDDWSGVYLHEVQHAALGTAPLGTAAFGATMAIGRFAGDPIIDRVGRSTTITWAAVIAAAGMFTAVAAPTAAVAIAGYGLLRLGVATIVPIAFGMAGNIAGTAPAWAISRVTTLGYLGLFSSPPVIGFVASATGLAVALAIPAGLLLAIVVLGRLPALARS